jgi:Undecaprenyl-phosphate galactose phosphotransferase WbaP
MKRKLLQPPHLAAKRLLDLLLALLVAVVLAPLLAFIALSVRFSSEGSIFFRQERIGRHGRRFYAYKFRSMYQNAGELLVQALSKDASLRAEWEEKQKLRNDPRITRIGRFLRHTSLDELPQLWNVIKGEMSLVGPRPIVASEIPRYGQSFRLYASVPGGITGLWQVSGRNDTSYEDRVSLDEYYVRNWSVWLDLYILARTIKAVLLRQGAY